MWEAKQFGLGSLTTNQSESFNCVLKRLQDWREAPVDGVVLSLFRLAQYFLSEIRRGRRGFGNFVLRQGLVAAQSDVSSTSYHVYEPNQIVEGVRTPAVLPTQTTETTACSQSPNTVLAGDMHYTTSQESGSDTATESTQFTQPQQNAEPDDHAQFTATERASTIIASGQISLDAKLGVFTVMGTNEPRVVRLFPRTTCSCPATSTCYHILASRMSIGIREAEPTRRVLNLTQLRRNKRKRADKVSGRKRPRVQDVDVRAADDHDSLPSQVTSANPSDSTSSIIGESLGTINNVQNRSIWDVFQIN